MPVPYSYKQRRWLKHLMDVRGLTYRQIAQKPYFCHYSTASLCRFRKRGKLTKAMRQKWSRKRHRIAISKLDPASAARSIRENCYFTVDELVKELKCQT